MKNRKQLTENEKKYKNLAEVYLSKYENQNIRNTKIMLAKGVIVEMESDLAFFHINSPQTDKSQRQLERLNILRSAINDMANVHSFNWQMNDILSNFYRENEQLKNEITTLKQSLEDLMLTKDL